MADINKEDIKLLQSRRMDDTPQGGGTMTANEVVAGQINSMFPDISRLDHVGGRVSMRKVFPAVLTGGRETYYGAHMILTKQASDPLVSVMFFSDKNWFSTREEARKRMESYLTRGPQTSMTLWGNHYQGTSHLSLFCYPDFPVPDVGDVLVLHRKSDGHEQYVRIIELESSIQTFFMGNVQHTPYDMNIVSITIGSRLDADYVGEEVASVVNLKDNETEVLSTVPADASRYYGVANIVEPITQNSLQLRVDDIRASLVPSAASETGITDAGVGTLNTIMVQESATSGYAKVSRQVSYTIQSNATLYVGEGVLPGSLSLSAANMTDDAKGNILIGSEIVGSIDYGTGVINLGQVSAGSSGSGTLEYYPAAASSQVSDTAAIDIETNNRGYVYNHSCYPLPQQGSVRVEYLAGGKWYTLRDEGDGHLVGFDPAVGTGSVNYDTGAVSVTLGSMPDIGSKVMFFWNKPSEFYNVAGESLKQRYRFNLQDENITKNTLVMAYSGDGNGTGPNGEYALVDDGSGNIVWAEYDTGNSDWQPSTTITDVFGRIWYATGHVDFEMKLDLSQSGRFPTLNDVWSIDYNHGEAITETFVAPPRDGNGHINITLSTTPILPNTFRIEWHTMLEEYEVDTRVNMHVDPTYIFRDDGNGEFDGDADDGTTNWVKGTIDYNSGGVTFHPDRTSVFPHAQYKWITTQWMHPGIVQSRVFDKIEYLPAMSVFPTDGNVVVSYCSVAGANAVHYTTTLNPTYIIAADKNLELVPGSIAMWDYNLRYITDNGDGNLYSSINFGTGDKIQVGGINYSTGEFQITSDAIDPRVMYISFATATGKIEPVMSILFRTPGAPIRPGSLQISATTDAGTHLTATSDFNGDIVGIGVVGHIDGNTGAGQVAFGEWVPDDAAAQGEEWYPGAPTDGSGNVWKPFVVHANTIKMNCVITSYLPLDKDLIGIDPVRLPLDGKVPIFRDGYIITIQNEKTDAITGLSDPVSGDTTVSASRGNVDTMAVYAVPTQYQLDHGTQVCPVVVPELSQEYGEYTVDLVAGEVTFKDGFVRPKDSQGTPNDLVIVTKIEDMVMASDVQVTGHISVVNPITHDYPVDGTTVSSVLPYGDLQSRIYNEFVQNSWNGNWSDTIDGNPPLANYNFVDHPITVTNRPSIKERWLVLFLDTEHVRVVGEQFGVLIDSVKVINVSSPPNYSQGNPSGVYNYNGEDCLVLVNDNFHEPYWVMALAGFGFGWSGGNCIRFNQDAANYPSWFIRTTLLGPPTEPTDNYVVQVRGNSS